MKTDIAIFFDCGKNTGMIFYDINLEDLEHALINYYSDNFYTLKDSDGNDIIINLSKVEFIRVTQRKGNAKKPASIPSDESERCERLLRTIKKS